jgi:hypothetical protein
MDKMDDLKVELKAMERIAKILHDLPNSESVIRVAAWIQEVTQTEHFEAKEEAPTFAVIEKQLESLPHSELSHLRGVINWLIGGLEPVANATKMGNPPPVEGKMPAREMLPSGRSPVPPQTPPEM